MNIILGKKNKSDSEYEKQKEDGESWRFMHLIRYSGPKYMERRKWNALDSNGPQPATLDSNSGARCL